MDFLGTDLPLTDGISWRGMERLCKEAKNKKNILEIGTRFARTTINLAYHCPADGRVISIDVNHKDAHATLASIPEEIRKKILLIEMDSKLVDFKSIGPFDMAFIDGDHSFEGARIDTENVLNNLAKGGILFWHDFTCLDVLAAVTTFPVEKTQLDDYMGCTWGTPSKSNVTNLQQLTRVANAINQYLTSINWR